MALVNPNIAMSFRGVEVPQQNALADYAAVQQIQSGQRQAEVSQMQIEQMRRDEATLKQIQDTSIKHGGPTDLDSIADAYLKSGNPKFVEFGVGLRQKLDEKKQFASIMGNVPRAAAPASEPYPGYNESIGMTPSVNAMAPAAAPVTNALADVAMLRQRRDALLSMGTPQAIAAARALDSDIQLASKPPVRQVVSAGSTVLGPDNQVVFTAPAAPVAPPTSVAEFERAKKDPAFMKFLQDRAAATRAPVQPVAPTITTVEDPNNPGKFLQVDARQYRGGGAGAPGVIGGARPSALSEKTATQKVQLGKDINQAIFELKNAAKTGGLIDKSTGSGAGRLYDIGAGFFGSAPEGAIATGQLAPIADLVLKMVPRFEGPQSDKDTQSYKAAAGQLADSSLPTKIRKAAANEIIRLMEARKNQFGSADMAAPAGGGGVAPPPGFNPD